MRELACCSRIYWVLHTLPSPPIVFQIHVYSVPHTRGSAVTRWALWIPGMHAVFGRQRGVTYWASLNMSYLLYKGPSDLSIYVSPGWQETHLFSSVGCIVELINPSEMDGCRCREVYGYATRGQYGHIVASGHMRGLTGSG